MKNVADMIDIVQDIAVLQPMPESLKRLAEVASDPDAGLEEMEEVIKYDQTLTACLLRMANSAWSGASRRIETVRQAIVRVGVSWILGIATGQQLQKKMMQPCRGYSLAERELWRHSLATAIAASKISAFTQKTVPPGAFTAALMHDIGKLILTRHHDPQKIARIAELVEGGALYLEAERTVLGTDHAAVGGMMAKHWQFPDSLVKAIELHHDPDAEPDALLDAVHVANVVAKMLGIGLGSEQLNLKASTDAATRLGLSSKSMEALCAAVPDELSKTEELFEVTS